MNKRVRISIIKKREIKIESEKSMNKRVRISIIKKRETPAPRNIYDLNEYLINNMRYPVSGRANPGSSEAT